MMKNLFLCGVHRLFTHSNGEVLTIKNYGIFSSDITAVQTEYNSVHREVHSCWPGASHCLVLISSMRITCWNAFEICGVCHERPCLGYDSKFMYVLMTLGCFSSCMKDNRHQHCTEFGHIVRNYDNSEFHVLISKMLWFCAFGERICYVIWNPWDCVMCSYLLLFKLHFLPWK